MTVNKKQTVNKTLITNQTKTGEGQDSAQSIVTTPETPPASAHQVSTGGSDCNVGGDNTSQQQQPTTNSGSNNADYPYYIGRRFMYLTDLEPYTQHHFQGPVAPSAPPFPIVFGADDEDDLEDEYEEESFEDLVNALDTMALTQPDEESDTKVEVWRYVNGTVRFETISMKTLDLYDLWGLDDSSDDDDESTTDDSSDEEP